jgi:uncharacterized protein (TIRG00374 family)
MVLLRYAAAVVPIAWIFFRIDWSRMLGTLASIAWWTVPLLFCTTLGGMFLQGFRWWLLMTPFSKAISLSKALQAHFAGLYYSIVLPTSAAQNIVRAVILSKKSDYSLSWGSSWVSGVIGLFVLAILSLTGLAGIERSTLPPGFFVSMLTSFAVLALLCLLSFSKRFTGPVRKGLSRILPGHLLGIMGNIREAVYKYRDAKRNLFLVFVVTTAMQLLLFCGACLVLYGISGRFILFESFCYLPIIEILCIAVPITPNGLGLREGLLALMFMQVGLSKEQLGIYVMLGFFSITLKLVGGIALLFDGSIRFDRIKSSIGTQSSVRPEER